MMLDDCRSAQEKWGGVSATVDRWLKNRQQMLVVYCDLSDISDDPFDSERGNQVKTLCQIMVDYVSAGHFEVYNKLIEEGRDFDDQEALKTAQQMYKIIDKTTESVLDFNDKYQETDDLGTISDDLSKLGETLVSRFDAEDKMIEVLHIANRDKVA